MPARPTDRICGCDDCLPFSPRGRLFDNNIAYRAHLAAVLSKQRNTSPTTNYRQTLNVSDMYYVATTHNAARTVPTPIINASSKPSELQQNNAPISTSYDAATYAPNATRTDATDTTDDANTVTESLGVSSLVSQSSTVTAIRNKPWSQQKQNLNRHVVRSMQILSVVQTRLDKCSIILRTELNAWNIPNLKATFSDLRQALDRVKHRSTSVSSFKQVLTTQLNGLEEQFLELCSDTETLNEQEYDSEPWFAIPLESTPTIVQICFFFVIICHVMLDLSKRSSNIITGLLRILLSVVYAPMHSTMPFVGASILNQIPQSIGPILSQFNLDGRTIVYAVCPNCHFLYEPNFSLGSKTPRYPERCTHITSSENGLCNEPLFDRSSFGSSKDQPRRTFVYYDFDDYVAGLLSRKDLENRIDEACDSTLRSIKERPMFRKSLFDGDFIRNFEGPDSTLDRRKLFIDRGDEARLLFSLNLDFFHPHGMRIRGSTISSGIISMACLSLGLDICFLPEYMYIAGIISGPTESRGWECNNYIKPLVNALKVSWEKGVYYTRTANHSKGRRSRSAVILSVNDLPATRKLAGQANYNSHNYCSHCQNHGKDTLSNTDVESWQPRDLRSMRTSAYQWLATQSNKTRSTIFDSTGIRWSELWSLPYWNPQRQLVVDPMHCIFEGVIQRHIHEILEFTTVKAKLKTNVPNAFSYAFTNPDTTRYEPRVVKQVEQIQKLLLAPLHDNNTDPSQINDNDLYKGLMKTLMGKLKPSLMFVCSDLGRIASGSKFNYVSALIEWRKQFPTISENRPIKLVTEETIRFVQNVITTTETPSWISSVPKNFGDAAAGTIKADEWRIISLIYLPIALIALWGPGSTHSNPVIASRLLEALTHTMLLINAARIVSLRNMSDERAETYLTLMTFYVRELGTLYPEASLVVNHHMSLHMIPFFLDFGPARSWWCFPFERIIGILQRENTNAIVGSLESTMLNTFIRKSRLRCWLAQYESTTILGSCSHLLQSLTFWRREIEDDIVPQDMSSQILPQDLRRLAHTNEGSLKANFKKDGVVFSRVSMHVGNSLILFYPSGNFQNPSIPGQIEYIFSVKGITRFAIRQYLQAHTLVDPFPTFYPLFPARIFSSVLSEDMQIIELDWVAGHFARWNLSAEFVVVLALSRE